MISVHFLLLKRLTLFLKTFAIQTRETFEFIEVNKSYKENEQTRNYRLFIPKRLQEMRVHQFIYYYCTESIIIR